MDPKNRAYFVRTKCLHTSYVTDSEVEAGEELSKTSLSINKVNIVPSLSGLAPKGTDVVIGIRALIVRSKSVIKSILFDLDDLVVAILV